MKTTTDFSKKVVLIRREIYQWPNYYDGDPKLERKKCIKGAFFNYLWKANGPESINRPTNSQINFNSYLKILVSKKRIWMLI